MKKKNNPEKEQIEISQKQNKTNPSVIILSSVSIVIAVLSLLFSVYNNNKTQKLNEIVSQTKSDNLLTEAWDILVGIKGCDFTFKFVTDKTQLELANRKIDEAIQFTPQNPKSFLLKGMYNEAIENFSNALTFYKKAIELDPNSANNYLNLGNVFYKLEKYDDAENAYKKASLLDKDNFLIYNNLSVLYKKTTKETSAKKAEAKVKYIIEYKKINSIDSIKNDSLYQNIINRHKLQLGRGFNENTFKTDITNWKYSKNH